MTELNQLDGVKMKLPVGGPISVTSGARLLHSTGSRSHRCDLAISRTKPAFLRQFLVARGAW